MSSVAIAIVVLCGLTACATHPDGLLAVTEAASPAAHPIAMLVATTRAPDEDPGVLFGGDRGTGAVWREIVVSVPPAHVRRPGAIQWPTGRPADAATSFAVLAAEPAAADRRSLRRVAAGRRNVLVFVHGFNMDFGKAVYRFAQFVEDSGTDFVPVMFSWPSAGSILSYYYDRESMDGSRDALEATLRGLAADPDVDHIAVLAHSMGGWITLEALRTMAVSPSGVPAKIRDVVLASPDLDVGVFASEMKRIGRRPAVTVVVSRDDRILAFSSLVARGGDRLGAMVVDPAARASFDRWGVTTIDATDLHTLGRFNHFKFTDGPELARLIGRRLVRGGSVAAGDETAAAEAAAVGIVLREPAPSAAAGPVVAPPRTDRPRVVGRREL